MIKKRQATESTPLTPAQKRVIKMVARGSRLRLYAGDGWILDGERLSDRMIDSLNAKHVFVPRKATVKEKETDSHSLDCIGGFTEAAEAAAGVRN